jgi:hypothetical protein
MNRKKRKRAARIYKKFCQTELCFKASRKQIRNWLSLLHKGERCFAPRPWLEAKCFGRGISKGRIKHRSRKLRGTGHRV